jgi:hypothetical protein
MTHFAAWKIWSAYRVVNRTKECSKIRSHRLPLQGRMYKQWSNCTNDSCKINNHWGSIHGLGLLGHNKRKPFLVGIDMVTLALASRSDYLAVSSLKNNHHNMAAVVACFIVRGVWCLILMYCHFPMIVLSRGLEVLA